MSTPHRFLDEVERLGRRPFVIFMVGIAVFLFVYLEASLYLFTVNRARDSYSYYFASVALREGQDPYDLRVLESLGRTVVPGNVFPYLYPPLLAQLWRPLTLTDPETAHRIVVLLGTLFAAGNAFLLWRLFPKPSRPGTWLLAFLLFHAVCGPLVSSIRLGQINVFLGTLVFGALFLETEDRPWGAGFLLSLAILIKVVPALLMIDLLARGRKKTLLATCLFGLAITMVSISTAGLDPWVRFLQLLARPLPYNPPMSLHGLVEKVVGGAGAPAVAVQTAWLILSVALGLCLLPRLIAAWKRGADPIEPWSLLLLFSLLISPLTWHHHYYLALLPLGFLVLSARGPGFRATHLGLAFAVLLQYPSTLHALKPVAAMLALLLPSERMSANGRRPKSPEPTPQRGSAQFPTRSMFEANGGTSGKRGSPRSAPQGPDSAPFQNPAAH